ncbi:MAG: hypothetical protein IT580_15575 [Verrucomicrobiales bacterium]|nr:hypothetical protein [Verrucomicrobiales bacterium]
MGNKALGRDLGDLLSRARPSRLVDKVAPGLRAVSAPAPGAVSVPPEGAPMSPGPEDSSPVLEGAAAAGETPTPAKPALRPLPGAETSDPAAIGLASRPRISLGWGIVCFVVDAGLLAASVALVRWQGLSASWSLGLAVLAVVVGACFALLGVACWQRSPMRAPRIGEGGTRIRVQLKQ